MNETGVSVIEIHDLDIAFDVIKKLADSEFLTYARDDDVARSFAEKQLKFGHMLVAYLKNEPMGYICFYSNDLESRTGFITSIVIGECGIVRGRIFLWLIKEAAVIGKRDGMTGVRVQVSKENKHARRLYEAAGLTYTGEENENGLYMYTDIDMALAQMHIRTEN